MTALVLLPESPMVRLEIWRLRHEPTDIAFEPPGYLQLLFLYCVARDGVDTEIDPLRLDLNLPMNLAVPQRPCPLRVYKALNLSSASDSVCSFLAKQNRMTPWSKRSG
jgi:hypothetical protein